MDYVSYRQFLINHIACICREMFGSKLRDWLADWHFMRWKNATVADYHRYQCCYMNDINGIVG